MDVNERMTKFHVEFEEEQAREKAATEAAADAEYKRDRDARTKKRAEALEKKRSRSGKSNLAADANNAKKPAKPHPTASTYSALSVKDSKYKENRIDPPPASAQDVRRTRSQAPKRRPRIPLKRGMTTSRVRQYPIDPAPQSLVLPYVPVIRQQPFERTVNVERGNTMRNLKIKREKPPVPGWLQDLDENQLRAMMGIKDALTLEKQDPYTLLDEITNIVNKELGISMSSRTICNILRDLRRDGDGNYIFSDFLFFMGRPSLIKDAKKTPVKPQDQLDCDEAVKQCKQQGGDQKQSQGTDEGSSSGGRKKRGQGADDPSAFTEQERIFWSALLIFEMYETLQGVERLYFTDWIPPTEDRQASIQKARGFGPDSIGYKKIGTAEWDRPLPPLPKLSPYLHSVPFVTTRWAIQKPNRDEKGRRRTEYKVQPLHLVIQPPRKGPDPIKITENRMRIRSALAYLAEKGNCVALLPNIAFVIHLSDTFIDKLENITMKVTKSMVQKTVYHNNDVAWIAREIKDIYRPHGLPGNIVRLRPLIRYTDGLELRKICYYIRSNQWGFISNRKLQFREDAWRRMHVDRIPDGRLRDSFIYSFVTYLPYISHLPVHHVDNANPT